MKKPFGARFTLFLLAPFFFAVFADFSYIIISRRWEVVPYALPAEIIFYLLPLFLLILHFRKGLKPLLEGAADPSRAVRMLIRLPAATTLVMILSGLAYSFVNFYFSTALDNNQEYTSLGHIFLTAACGYMIMPAFIAWTFSGFWAESFRIRLHRERRLVIPAANDRISVQLVLVYFFVFTLPFLNFALDIRAWTLHPERFRDIFYTDILALVVAMTLAVITFTRRITRPITFLESAMDRVEGGDLDRSVPVLGNDETGRLTVRFNRMLEGLRERELLRDTFGKYLTPELATEILAKGGAIQPENRMVTVIFTDIESYTTLSEKLAPDEVVLLLNEYFSGIIAIISRYRGVVNKFIGDAVMAIFNAPVDDPDHAFHAVQAGLEIDRFCRESEFSGRKLRTRIGINTGSVVAGNIGSAERVEYTVIGDTVNVAQRLEAQNKNFGTTILTGPLTRELCGTKIMFTARGEVSVKGRSEPMQVYSPERVENNG